MVLTLIIITAIIVVVLAIVIADRFKIRRKPTAELAGILKTDNWPYYHAAIKELKRRGEDITRYEPRMLSHLTSDTQIQRGSARRIIQVHYPDSDAKLTEYLFTEAPKIIRQKFPFLASIDCEPESPVRISYDQAPVDLVLESRFIVMADPMALESLKNLALPLGPELTASRIIAALAGARAGFEVLLHEVPEFTPGPYRIVYSDIRSTTDEGPGRSATVDTGALVFFDYAKHSAVLTHLTWETYDLALQDATGRRFEEIAARIGFRSFGIMFGNADAGGDFAGDGTYMLKPTAPLRLMKSDLSDPAARSASSTPTQ